MKDSPIAVLSDQTGNLVPAIADANNVNRLAVDARITGLNGNQATVVSDGATTKRLAVDVRGAGVTSAQMVNKQMATSGGSTAINAAVGTLAAPVNFFYSPAAGTTATITRLTVFFEGTNYIQNGNTFLGVSALANGINIGATIAGTQYVFCTLKVTEDIITYSNGATTNTGSGGSLLGLSLGTVTSLQFVLPLAQPLTPTDQINVWVRDNINALGNGILFARGTVQGYLT